MKILILTSRWADDSGKNINCPTHRSIVRPAQNLFENNPDVDLQIEYIEKNNIWSESQLNERLMENDFDICIYSPYKNIVPSLKTAKHLGKKLFICVWDTHNFSTKVRSVNLRMFLKKPYDNGVVKFQNSMYEYSQYCNILVFDNGFGEVFPNIYGVFEPVDTTVLYPVDESEKTLDLSFIGSMYENERIWYVKKIQEAQLPITLIGGKGANEQNLPYEDWANANRISKISLNFNGNPFLGARKGRVWEIAACNNLMIATVPEVYNYSKGKYFIEGVHYVSINPLDFKEKIKYYLDNPQERITIANAMHEHWKANYSAEIWWNNIFDYSK